MRFTAAVGGTASDAIGELAKDCRVCGITRGQFSMLDILRAVLEQTGPADVVVSTWAADGQ